MKPKFFWEFLLSLTKALSNMYQTYHWQTRGGHFYGDHLLFERLYTAVDGEVDQVAERAIGVLNDFNLVDPVIISQNVSKIILMMTPKDKKAVDPEEMSLVLLFGEQLYAKHIAEMMVALEQQGKLNDGIADFIQGLASAHQTNIYLLQQRTHYQVQTPEVAESITASWIDESWRA